MEKSLPTLAAICTVVTALSACGTTPQHSNTAKTPAQATAFPVQTGFISPQQATEQSTGFEKQHRHRLFTKRKHAAVSAILSIPMLIPMPSISIPQTSHAM